VTGNPNGKDWVHRLFVDQVRPGYGYFHAKTSENDYLPEKYYENLRATYPPEWVERFLEGSFDVMEGQVYTEFGPTLHGISSEEEFVIPPEWPRFRGIDHGIHHPTCCLWAAVSPLGDLIFYDSYYKRGKLISENCEEIQRISGDENYEYSVIDPAVDHRDARTGTSYMDEYRKHGINCIKGEHALLDGISRVKEMMRWDDQHPHILTGELGAPHLYVFLSKCPELVHEIQQYKWRDQRPGAETREREEPVDRHNHSLDAMRYVVMSNPRTRELLAGQGIWAKWEMFLNKLKGKPDDNARRNDIGRWIGE
jgi:hypothetical protein